MNQPPRDPFEDSPTERGSYPSQQPGPSEQANYPQPPFDPNAATIAGPSSSPNSPAYPAQPGPGVPPNYPQQPMPGSYVNSGYLSSQPPQPQPGFQNYPPQPGGYPGFPPAQPGQPGFPPQQGMPPAYAPDGQFGQPGPDGPGGMPPYPPQGYPQQQGQFGAPPQQPQWPNYQPPPPAPNQPRRSGRPLLIIGIIVLVVLVLCSVVGVVAFRALAPKPISATTPTVSTSGNTTPTGNTPTSSTPTATTQVTNGGSNTVGQPVQAGTNWSITVTHAATSAGDTFIHPDPGNTFLVIDLTLKNVSSTTQPVSSLLEFSVQDSSGKKYTESITDMKPLPPDGNVAAGNTLTSRIVFQVPSSQHQYTFIFQYDIVNASSQVSWTINA